MMESHMALVTDYGNGYVERVISSSVALHWNWQTNGGRATFQKEMLGILNDELRSQQVIGRLEHTIDPANPKVFNVRVVDTFGVPVLDAEGNEQFQETSTMQIMEIHKAAFETLLVEQEAALEVPVAPAE
jgi:hypothetical protein